MRRWGGGGGGGDEATDVDAMLGRIPESFVRPRCRPVARPRAAPARSAGERPCDQLQPQVERLERRDRRDEFRGCRALRVLRPTRRGTRRRRLSTSRERCAGGQSARWCPSPQTEGEIVSAAALHYVNRLSDHLCVASRYVDGPGNGGDVLWVPRAEQMIGALYGAGSRQESHRRSRFRATSTTALAVAQAAGHGLGRMLIPLYRRAVRRISHAYSHWG